MTISTGSDIEASDFVDSSAGAGDSGKVPKLNASGKLDESFFYAPFGGDGSDGAFAASSGNTQIDLGGAAVVVKNYTSFALTGTATITFINPHSNGTTFILRSQGDVTITSTGTPAIELSGLGGSSDSSGWHGLGGASSYVARYGNVSNYSEGGTGGGNLLPGNTGGYTSFGAPNSVINRGRGGMPYSINPAIRMVLPGGGGTTGTSNNTPNGVGGRGGGAMLIECGGAWNFTGNIYANGVAGTASGGAGTAAGGGGAGGSVLVLYKTLTANSGTITVTAGAGGAANGGQAGGNGSIGQSLVTKNIWFV